MTTDATTTFDIGGDLTVNRLGYGAMQLPGPGVWGPSEDHEGALAVLRCAVELGVDFIDTANSYGPYVADELIAEALAVVPHDDEERVVVVRLLARGTEEPPDRPVGVAHHVLATLEAR